MGCACAGARAMIDLDDDVMLTQMAAQARSAKGSTGALSRLEQGYFT